MSRSAIARTEVLERLFNALWREGLADSRRLESGEAVLEFPGGGELRAAVRHLRALDRLATAPPYRIRSSATSPQREFRDPGEALEVLAHEPGHPRLAAEVRESAANLELFLDAAAERAGRYPSGRGFLERVFALASGPSPDVLLEGWILRGHTLHPGTKTRTGFTAEDLRRYSPELECRVPLRFVKVRATHVVERRMERAVASLPEEWRLEAGDGWRVLAVHPWQAERVLPKVFARELAEGTLVPLDAEHPAWPLASLRTLVPDLPSPGVHLKLPLAIQATSALRTVSAQSAQNGPRLSDLVQALCAGIPGLARTLELQVEPRGLHFWDPGAPDDDPEALERARHLSMLLRLPPATVPGTWTVPAAVLAELSPLDGRPLACELAAGDPLGFVAAYAEATARGILPPLMVAGLALEAHAQNCLVRFRQGRPEALVVRDLGGLRLLPGWMREAGLDPALHPSSVLAARTPEELVSKSHHCWLQGHLAPLLTALAEGDGVPEADLWRIASGAIRKVFEETLPRVPAHRRAVTEELLFRPRIQVKALTVMRLKGESHRYDFCEVPNPLA